MSQWDAMARVWLERPAGGLWRRHSDVVNRSLLEDWLPHYVQDNRHYLTVAIGCTGGQHRSVYIVEALARRFAPTERVLVRHRALAGRAQAATASQTP